MAEKEGKTVELLVVPAVNPFDAMVQTAARLKATRLVTGVSARMDIRGTGAANRAGLGESAGAAASVFAGSDQSGAAFTYVNLGPHPPRLWPEDVDRLHEFWLKLSETNGVGAKLHHRDVIGVALRRLEKELSSDGHDQVIRDLLNEMRRG